MAVNQARMYDIIVAPVITEKSTRISEHEPGGVPGPRRRDQARDQAAVEGLFNVKVTAVNTLNVKGKVKRFRGTVGRRSDLKKAIVTLAEGQIIDVTTGI